MKQKLLGLILVAVLILPACEKKQLIIKRPKEILKLPQTEEGRSVSEEKSPSLINPKGERLETRILLPEGFCRQSVAPNSFGAYLRSLPLKESGAKVHYYDGKEKPNHGVYEAVVDMDIGTLNLQQCADAIMRLRAEYLFQEEDYEKIQFHLTNGFLVDYSKWCKGYRVKVSGNQTEWVQKAKEAHSYLILRQYLDFVFTYAGTLSLARELVAVNLEDMAIGDVFIQGGSPGHGVMVCDMAYHEETGQKIYLLLQSYMPAQDIQILKNPKEEGWGPWYLLEEDHKIQTPEWTFLPSDLKRFP